MSFDTLYPTRMHLSDQDIELVELQIIDWFNGPLEYAADGWGWTLLLFDDYEVDDGYMYVYLRGPSYADVDVQCFEDIARLRGTQTVWIANHESWDFYCVGTVCCEDVIKIANHLW